MKRREFIAALLGSAATLPSLWPLAALAENQPNPAAAAADDSIGQVATLNGNATVKRGDAVAVALKIADHIFLNDALQTAIDSALGVTFDDETTFSLSANTQIVVDKFVYAPDGKDNAAAIHVAKGTAAFVASLVAKTGDMSITTDSVTIGVRGTTGIVEVPEAGPTPTIPPTIKLYADAADGHVGQIEVSDFQGNRLGTLTREASAFSIRAGAGGRLSAVSFQIPQVEAVRDRGVLTRLVTSHNIGRPLAIERRQLRLNTPQNNNRNNNQNNIRDNNLNNRNNNNQNNQNNNKNNGLKGNGQNGRTRLNRNDRGQNLNQDNGTQAGTNKTGPRFQGTTIRPVVTPKITATPPRVRVPSIPFSIKPY